MNRKGQRVRTTNLTGLGDQLVTFSLWLSLLYYELRVGGWQESSANTETPTFLVMIFLSPVYVKNPAYFTQRKPLQDVYMTDY